MVGAARTCNFLGALPPPPIGLCITLVTARFAAANASLDARGTVRHEAAALRGPRAHELKRAFDTRRFIDTKQEGFVVADVRSAKDFFKPLALGAPTPPREIPFAPSRMIHFFDPSNEKMRSKLGDLAKRSDVLLGNLEDGVPTERKTAARQGLVDAAKSVDFGACRLWTRINS